jgi:PAS domain S-box-containing protein
MRECLRVERELKNNEQRFRDFASSAVDWYWEMEQQLRFSYFSPRFEAVTGVPPRVLLGKTRQETGVPNVEKRAWNAHLGDLAAVRPFREFVHPPTLVDGSEVWLAINGAPVFNGNGAFTG